jgi:TPP-dependent pyruvate/acetoin dehydrogenase alpha subunit
MTVNVKGARPARVSKEKATPLIGDDKLRQLYASMLKCRMLQERALKISKRSKVTDNLSFTVGQEATTVGVVLDLRPGDMISPSQGDSIANFIKGVPLRDTLCQISARNDRRRKIQASAANPSDNITPFSGAPASSIAAQLSIATGVALTYSMQKAGNVVVTFCNDVSLGGSAGEEALMFAGANRLPILYVLQKNIRAASHKSKAQTKRKESGWATDAYGFPAIPVDGNDVVAVYRVAHEAIKRARQGGGPTLIQCEAKPFVSSPKAGGERRAGAGEITRLDNQTDPIRMMEHYLAGKELFSAEWKEQFVRNFRAELDAAVKDSA